MAVVAITYRRRLRTRRVNVRVAYPELIIHDLCDRREQRRDLVLDTGYVIPADRVTHVAITF